MLFSHEGVFPERVFQAESPITSLLASSHDVQPGVGAMLNMEESPNFLSARTRIDSCVWTS